MNLQATLIEEVPIYLRARHRSGLQTMIQVRKNQLDRIEVTIESDQALTVVVNGYTIVPAREFDGCD